MSFRYHPTVFILPPWREIYETDKERKQTWEEAAYTYQQLKIVYQRYVYETVEVPKDSVEERRKVVTGFCRLL